LVTLKVKRSFLIIGIAVTAGCGSGTLDRTKFDSIRTAVDSIRSDLRRSDGIGSDRFSEALRQLEAEISSADSRTQGRREAAVLKSYASAAEMYRWFFRFKDLGAKEVDGMVLLTGRNRIGASRYEFPFENRGGGRWVNRRAAMKKLTDEAEAHLAEAERLQTGEK
jgi:hypothetical protein